MRRIYGAEPWVGFRTRFIFCEKKYCITSSFHKKVRECKAFEVDATATEGNHELGPTASAVRPLQRLVHVGPQRPADGQPVHYVSEECLLFKFTPF
ncbi:hypothetical protein EVAR_20549_1 [Eumeta japonica]|uniref:Uncharacterized protein n=1 Tax=Eumeta variegata TaxID=151549 RepID=A0A4C1URV5_EUMVA|nr:hypothetical protein EVAR_20549_1 [Eumeta japonica]